MVLLLVDWSACSESTPGKGKGRLTAEMVAVSTTGTQNAETKRGKPKIILVKLVPIAARTRFMARLIVWLASTLPSLPVIL